jgi:hypothetical protein
VAKDTKYLHESNGDSISDAKGFHKVFCKTQLKAQKYAGIFNEKMLKLECVDARKTPNLEFLTCSVYMVESPTEGRQAYLVERMLDIKSFGYQKWNDNAGRVGNVFLEALVEEEEESDSDESAAVSHSSDDGDRFGDLFGGRTSDSCFSSEEIPQAFSCFSYWESERRFLIRDLQGVFNTTLSPPIFELTDPVIHHRETSETCKKYGPSDKGLEGMNAFFESHKCSNLCRVMKCRFQVDIDVPQGPDGEIGVVHDA